MKPPIKADERRWLFDPDQEQEPIGVYRSLSAVAF
jgi:hypothetical protein